MNELRDAIADRLNETWPHLFCDGFQNEVAGEIIEVIREEAGETVDEAGARHDDEMFGPQDADLDPEDSCLDA